MVRDVADGVASTGQLELQLAGVFAVVRDGVRLADGDVGSRKARRLLKLLTALTQRQRRGASARTKYGSSWRESDKFGAAICQDIRGHSEQSIF